MVFDKFNQLKTHHQVLFSILIVFAVVAVWRGLWGIMDEFLLPNNYLLSSLVSLVVGLVILTSTHYTIKELM